MFLAGELTSELYLSQSAAHSRCRHLRRTLSLLVEKLAPGMHHCYLHHIEADPRLMLQRSPVGRELTAGSMYVASRRVLFS